MMPMWDEYNCKQLTTTITSEVTISDIVYRVEDIKEHQSEQVGNRYIVKRQGVHGEFFSIEDDEAEYVVNVMYAADERFNAFEEPPF
jgi:hypothetical protein